MNDDKIGELKTAKYLYEVDDISLRMLNWLSCYDIETVDDFLARPLDWFLSFPGFKPESFRMRDVASIRNLLLRLRSGESTKDSQIVRDSSTPSPHFMKCGEGA